MAAMTFDRTSLHVDEDCFSWWFSPNGVNRVWFDSLREAMDETGLRPHANYGYQD